MDDLEHNTHMILKINNIMSMILIIRIYLVLCINYWGENFYFIISLIIWSRLLTKISLSLYISEIKKQGFKSSKANNKWRQFSIYSCLITELNLIMWAHWFQNSLFKWHLFFISSRRNIMKMEMFIRTNFKSQITTKNLFYVIY